MSTDDEIRSLVEGAEAFLVEAAGDEILLQAVPVLMAVDQLLARARTVAGLRAVKGRGLSSSARDLLMQIHDELERLAGALEGRQS